MNDQTAQDDDTGILVAGQLIKGKYKVFNQIGLGSFGELYEAQVLAKKGLFVAVKVEREDTPQGKSLKFELNVLRNLQGLPHICKLYDFGRTETYAYIIMDLQGSNLCVLRRNLSKRIFSLSTTVRLSIQMLESIKSLHDAGFCHRDIKPSNFAMGRLKHTSKTVFLLDFGLSRRYTNKYGKILKPRKKVGFRGTIRYASPSAHNGEELGRHDDLFSLLYTIVEFLNGTLPWRLIMDKDEVGNMKKNIIADQLLNGLPDQLKHFHNHLQTLDYFTRPDYEFLLSLLESIQSEYNVCDDDPFDWVFSSTGKEFPRRTPSKKSEHQKMASLEPVQRSQSKSKREMMKSVNYESANARTMLTDGSAYTGDCFSDSVELPVDEAEDQ